MYIYIYIYYSSNKHTIISPNTFVELHGIRAFGSNSGFVISKSLISSDILPFSVLLRSRNKSDLVVSLPTEGKARCQDRPIPKVWRSEAERVKLTHPEKQDASTHASARGGAWQLLFTSDQFHWHRNPVFRPVCGAVISFLDCEILFLGFQVFLLLFLFGLQEVLVSFFLLAVVNCNFWSGLLLSRCEITLEIEFYCHGRE